MFQLKFSHSAREQTTAYYYGEKRILTVGAFSYIGEITITVYDLGPEIYIGKYSSIANDVEFVIVSDHSHDLVSQYPFNNPSKGSAKESSDFVIGSDVWIGKGVKLLRGCAVGHGSVLGAYSVVTKRIEPYGIYIGNPIELLRFRCNADRISELLDIAWWEWPHEQVISNMALLKSKI
jgi:acetyltransferase-like isoleucine patch superfamily enzyme